LLNRNQYALGVSYINDLVRGAIEPKPYWITELQGGNNIYSAPKPMDPTSADIAQWVWTSVGAGADRVMFWLLNAGRAGYEAGEWSMLDFQQKPSEKLKTASAIARVLDAHQDFFTGSRPAPAPVTVVLSLGTMTYEEVFQDPDDPARQSDAHLLSVLGFYEALAEIGPPPQVKYFDDYAWTGRTASPRIVILADARELTKDQIESLNTFVANGNILLISGLTGFYGPHAIAWPLAGFPLAKVTGGELKEVHMRSTVPVVRLSQPPNTELPSRFWISTIAPQSATPIGEESGEVTATERDVPGGGRVIWIPSPVGLGAWLTNSEPLARYLQSSFSRELAAEPFRFSQPQNGCVLRVLENASDYVTVVTNGRDVPAKCVLTGPSMLRPDVLWGAVPGNSGDGSVFDLAAGGTSVVLWSRAAIR
jgi:beta-galactosidase